MSRLQAIQSNTGSGKAKDLLDAVQAKLKITRQPRAGLVHHSDRGLQYASPEYVAALDRHGMIASMSRPGQSV